MYLSKIFQKMSGSRSIAFNTGLGLATSAINIPLVMIAGIIVGRWLGPEQRGAWAILLTINVVFAQIFSFGMPLAMSVFTAKRTFDLGQIHTIAILFAIASGTLGFLLYLAFQTALHLTVLRGVDPHQAVIALMVFPSALYGIMWDNIVTGLQKISTFSVFGLLQAVVNLIMPIVALVVLDAGLSGLLVVWLIGSIFITIARIFWMLRLTQHSFSWDRRAAQRIFGFGIKMYPAFALAVLLGQTDVFFLNYFHGGRELGFYAVASALAARIGLLGATLTTASNARLTSGNSQEVSVLLCSLLRRMIAGDLVLVIFLALLSSQIIVILYGDAYRPSTLPFAVLLLAAVFRSLSQLLAIHVVNHRTRPDIALAFAAISLLAAIVLFALLVPNYGALGCAYAVMLTSLIEAGLYLWTFLRVASLPLRSAIVWQREDSSWLLSLCHRAGILKART